MLEGECCSGCERRGEEGKCCGSHSLFALASELSPLYFNSILLASFSGLSYLAFFFLLLFFNISYEFTFSNLIFIIYIFFPCFFFYHKLYIKKLFCFTKTCSPN